jgi:hypothetical protein
VNFVDRFNGSDLKICPEGSVVHGETNEERESCFSQFLGFAPEKSRSGSMCMWDGSSVYEMYTQRGSMCTIFSRLSVLWSHLLRRI